MKKLIEKKDKDTTTSKNLVVLSSKIPNLLEDSKRHIVILGLFINFKGITFDNKEQQQSFIKRNVRDSKQLVDYSDERIIKIMTLLRDRATFDWKISTVVKYITNPDPENNCFFGKNINNNILIG